MNRRQLFIILGGIVAIVLFIAVYDSYNPTITKWMPKCPSMLLFGVECPGCGTQRAIHSILNGEFRAAFFYNPLMVLSVPYILLLLLSEITFMKIRYPRFRAIISGQKSIWIVLALLILYTIIRNQTSLF